MRGQLKNRFSEGRAQRRVDQVRVGDRIDLQNDRYADPDGTNREFPFEFAVVSEIERETPTCVRLDTSQGSFGFPPDHWVNVNGEQVRT